MSSETEIRVGHLVTWADDDAAKKYGGALGDIEGDPRERETREVVEVDMGRGGRGCALLRDGLAYQWVPLWRLRHAAPMQVHQVDRVVVGTATDDSTDDGTVWVRWIPYTVTAEEMSKAMAPMLVDWRFDGPPMPEVARDTVPSGNEDCPRCGGRRLVLLDTVEHVGPCETADDVEPVLTPHRLFWCANAGQEWGFRASGRGVSAGHPTRDGAIAAWREKLRERGMR